MPSLKYHISRSSVWPGLAWSAQREAEFNFNKIKKELHQVLETIRRLLKVYRDECEGTNKCWWCTSNMVDGMNQPSIYMKN